MLISLARNNCELFMFGSLLLTCLVIYLLFFRDKETRDNTEKKNSVFMKLNSLKGLKNRKTKPMPK